MLSALTVTLLLIPTDAPLPDEVLPYTFTWFDNTTSSDDDSIIQLGNTAPIDTAPEQSADINTKSWEWKHNISLAVNLTESEQSTFSGRLKYNVNGTNGNQEWSSNLQYRTENREDTDPRHRANATLELLHTLYTSNWRNFVRHESEHDSNKDWETSVALYSGFLYQIMALTDLEFDLRMGIGVRYEFGEVKKLSPESIFGGSTVDYRIANNQTLSAEFIIYPQLTEEDYRFDATIEWKINLSQKSNSTVLTIGAENEYTSDYDKSKRESGHDLRIYTGIGYTF